MRTSVTSAIALRNPLEYLIEVSPRNAWLLIHAKRWNFKAPAKVAEPFCGGRGRDASHPTPPAQILTSGTTARRGVQRAGRQQLFALTQRDYRDAIAGHPTTRGERDAIRQREIQLIRIYIQEGRERSERLAAAGARRHSVGQTTGGIPDRG
jgi:hypothetical protein